MLTVGRRLFFAIAAGALVGCGSHNESSQTSSVPSFPKNNTYFQALVAHGEYQKALEVTCKDYGIDCNKVSHGSVIFSQNLAETSALTNKITLSKRAFYSPTWQGNNPPADYSERYQMADQRMFAVLLQHEVFHRERQSRSERYGADRASRFLNDPVASYYLEFDAWASSVDLSRKMGLHEGHFREKSIVFWVEGQKEYYEQLIANPNANFD